MTIPLVMNAAPLDSNTKNENSNENNFIKQTSILPRNGSQSLNNNKVEKVSGLKKLIQNIHDSAESTENDLYNSLSNYEGSKQKSEKPAYKPKNDLHKMSNTKLAYEEVTNNENNSLLEPGMGLTLDNRDELLQKVNYIIYTLDKQKDIKSDQKIEELLLYSFLGIFIIYVLDSFTKIGKYKR